MRTFIHLNTMLGLIWCGIGVIVVIAVCTIYGRFIPDTLDADKPEHWLVYVTDTIGAILGATLLWPWLLRDFCTEYNDLKWVL